MNIKRYFKKQAKEDRQAILDEDEGKTLRALGIEIPEKKSRRRAWIAGAATAASLAVACVFVFYPFSPQPSESPPVEYLESNFVTENSTIEKMNSELHDFTLTFDETAYQVSLTRTYDSVSNEVLYYKLYINSYDFLLSFDLHITCNKNYHTSDFAFSKPIFVEDLPEYTITYQQDTSIDPQFDPVEAISCMAEIKGEIDRIYITNYKEVLLDPDHTFFDSIQGFIHAK